MKFVENITVIGSDARQFYLYKYLEGMGYRVLGYGVEGCGDAFNDLDEALRLSPIVIAPVPVSRYLDMSFVMARFKAGQTFIAGNIPESFTEYCKENGIQVYDFLGSENLARENAVLTGEGVISEIIRNTLFSVRDSKALVIGCGRCGSVISRMLEDMGCEVSVLEENREAVAALKACGFRKSVMDLNRKNHADELQSFDFIVNTVPAVVLDGSSLAECRRECVLFDIASKPGFDEASVRRLDMKYIKLPGIPGRFSPKTAGELIAKDVIGFLS